jgi:hypothetical protein
MFDYDNARETAENEINLFDVLKEIFENNSAEDIYNQAIKGYDEEESFILDIIKSEYDFKEALSDKDFIREFIENEIDRNSESGFIDWIIESPEYESQIESLIERMKDNCSYEEDLQWEWRNSR